VVRGDERVTAGVADEGQQSIELSVDRLAGRDGGLVVAGVADHVGVGVVRHEHVRVPLGDHVPGGVGHLARTHRWRLVVGGHVRRLDDPTDLSVELDFATAVEEVRDVGVLLRLGDPELCESVIRQHRTQGRLGLLRRERHREVERLVVLGHRDEFDRRRCRLDPRRVPVVRAHVCEHPSQLTSAVGTEVTEHHGVAVREPRVVADDGRLDELVGVAAFVRPLDRFDCGVGSVIGFSGDDSVVRASRPFPVLVAIHRVVPPGDGRDTAGATLGGDTLQFGEILSTAVGRGVTAVGERVGDGLDTTVGGRLDQCVEVRLSGVDTAVTDESEQVESAVVAGVIERVLDGVDPVEPALGDRVVDPRVRLVDDAAGTDVLVADLAVAHLSLREADGAAVRPERPERTGLANPVERRRLGSPDGVPSVVIPQRPPVEHDQRGAHTRGSPSRRFRSVGPSETTTTTGG